MCIENIFFKTKKLQMKILVGKSQVALRKCNGNNRNLTAGHLKQEGVLERLVHFDEGYKFLRALRGSPRCFERAKKDIFAMIRQLGPATLLPTRWPTPEGWPSSWQIIERCMSTEEKSHLSVRDPFMTIFGCK